MKVRFDCDAPGERPSRLSAGQAVSTNFRSAASAFGVGRDDLQSLGEVQRGPARADHAGADDADAANGFVGHVISPMCLSMIPKKPAPDLIRGWYRFSE